MNQLKIDSGSFTPSKIICVGRNYLEHIRELGNETPETMLLFNKPNSSISDELQASREGEALHYEAEICFMVRRNSLHAVGVGLDLTRRELQARLKSKGMPWERAKAFNGAACFSDFRSLGDHAIENLSLQLEINDELRQQGDYELMMHKPDQILAEILEFQALEDGDIIMTGTPQGVGQVIAGNRFSGRILCNGEILASQQWQAV